MNAMGFNKKNILFVVIFQIAAFFAMDFGGGVNSVLAEKNQPETQPLQEITTMNVVDTFIEWIPNQALGEISLTVSGPDELYIKRTFQQGEAPFLDVANGEDGLLPDGSYNYELVASPPTIGKGKNKILKSRGGIRDEQDRAGMRVGKKDRLMQSGAFSILEGKLIAGGSDFSVSNSDSDQPWLTRDQVINDDLIVGSSLCVGFDCVNGESFGFDTIKLKENNLRIKFDDTSNSASFPSFDWQITVNDSSNGGQNKFSIDDITSGRTPFTIQGTAPSHSLFVNSSGNLGLGTSTPLVEIHVKDGDSPTLRLEQDGSSGFAAQTWDLVGNEANFFIRDATNGSKLPFRIKPNAPTNTLYLDSSGNVGVGTASPSFVLHVKNSANAVIVAEQTGGPIAFFNAEPGRVNFGSATDHNVKFARNAVLQMELIGNSDISMADGGGYNGTWNAASSRDLKENIKSLDTEEAMAALKKLEPVTFNYKDQKDEEHIGFIAEDVPDVVANKDRKSLSTMDLVAVLTRVVQQQQKELVEMKRQMGELKMELPDK